MARSDSLEGLILSKLDEISDLVMKGCTDEEIAAALEIGYSTFRKYKSENEELKYVIALAKDKLNQEVERAVFKKATGFHYIEEVATKVKRPKEVDGSVVMEERVVVSKVQKYSPPDLVAQKFWLENKDTGNWNSNPHKTDTENKALKLKQKELDNKGMI